MQTQDLVKSEKDDQNREAATDYSDRGDRVPESRVKDLAELDTAEADLSRLVEAAQNTAQSVSEATINIGSGAQEPTVDQANVEKALSDSELVAEHAVRASRAVTILRTTVNVGEPN